MLQGNPTLERLEDQIAWYDRGSISNQRRYKGIKIATLVAAGVIPFAAGYGIAPPLTGALGVLVVVLEGLQSLNQYEQNWITYRSTCEALRHEKYLWLAKAGPYSDVSTADKLLAERVESLISREHAKWVSAQEHAEQAARKSLNPDRRLISGDE